MDMAFESEFPVKFNLVAGAGPVHIIAQHMIGMKIGLVIVRFILLIHLKFQETSIKNGIKLAK